jgi:hypothetical protein
MASTASAAVSLPIAILVSSPHGSFLVRANDARNGHPNGVDLTFASREFAKHNPPIVEMERRVCRRAPKSIK